jgi:putative oxidoreductase
MKGVQTVLAILGRVCLSTIFILSGVNKIADWLGTEQAVLNALYDFMNYTQGVDWIQKGIRYAIPWSTLLVVLAIIFELVGGILVFFGFKARLGAFLLLMLLIPATLLFHHFWWLQGADRELQMTMFLKNLSIFGGLLLVLAFGSGSSKPKPAPNKG